ncbi:MAG: hypothetical protein ACKOIB_05320, partial [Verrucomicrobiota bacterium]
AAGRALAAAIMLVGIALFGSMSALITYRHTEHTAGWIEFGLQFRDVMRDRPTICIPDDHDVGHPNLWGEDGKESTAPGNADGGYMFPVAYVNMVQRQQTWHLPDAFNPTPVLRDIGVYYTRLKVGGMDFAILEDRKFKSGPLGKIPQQGPRPDHITDEKYDPKSIDLPGLQLLGARQMKFLADWSADWKGVSHKAVLSATAFCGAVHMHGGKDDRLLADLDCNGWPQTARNEALRALRRVRAGLLILRVPPAAVDGVHEGRTRERIRPVAEGVDAVLDRDGQMLVTAEMHRPNPAERAQGLVAGGLRPAVAVEVGEQTVVLSAVHVHGAAEGRG